MEFPLCQSLPIVRILLLWPEITPFMNTRRYTAFLAACLFLLFTMPARAQQGTGTIKGHITTNDARPAAWVTVELKGSRKTVSTDEKGYFILKNIKPGTYELAVTLVGYESAIKSVVVEENKTATVDIPMSVSDLQLQEVIITSNKNAYNTRQTSSSLRLNEPLLEVPQNIQVVTGANLADQQVISMSDAAIRNVSGAVRLEHWGDMYTNITMRGSQIQAFRNGFNVVNSYWGPLTEDMSFVDHIEFVKGPAGFMLANGDPSGLYNVVTKKPTGQTKGEASFTVGSFDLYRTTLDLDGKLSKDGHLLYRLNLAAQNKKSFRDFEYNNRYSIAPVISYQIDEKTKLTAEYTLQSAKMSDVGSFYVFAPTAKGYASLPRNFTAMQPGLEPTRINDHSVTLNLQHQISPDWKLTAQVAYYNYKQIGTSLWPSQVNADGTMIRNVGIWDAKSEMTLGQFFLNGSLTTGKVAHRILGGLDMGTKEYYADWSQSHNLDTANGGEFNTLLPNYGAPANGYPVWDRSKSIEARAVAGGGTIDQRYSGVYLSDELGFLDNTVRLTLAGRYTYVKQSSWGGPAEEAKHITPRVGLSVSIDRNTSVYALYDQAFVPQTGRLSNGSTVQPITGNNTEFGIKRDWANGKWNTTLSVYRILKNNELIADPDSMPNSGYSVELGQKRAQGVEFDIRGTIVKGLSVVANYAFTESVILKVAKGVTDYKVGDVVPGFSKHTVNSWVNYKFSEGVLKGAGISAGFTWLLNRATSDFSANVTQQSLPDYFKLDGGIFWEKDKIKLTLNAFNILDKYIYSGSYYDWLNAWYWQAEAPRNVRLGISYKF
jgi:iron complex outermembrane receptor protein